MISKIEKVRHHGSEKYPWSIMFVADSQAADPEAISGVLVKYDDGSEYIVCVAPDDEMLVFTVLYEMEEDEKERMGLKPGLTMTNADGFVDDVFAHAWAAKAYENPSEDEMEKLRKAMEVDL